MDIGIDTAKLEQLYDTFGLEWQDYGPPTKDDLAVAVAALVDYLDGIEGVEGDHSTIELPNAGLMVIRSEGVDNLWVRVGDVEIVHDQD